MAASGIWYGGGVLLLLFLWAAFLYNRLVRTRNYCDEAWSGIDTELKRRYDLIPNLVETVKGYARHEREVLEMVVKARAQAMASQGSPESQARDENVLVASLRQLFALTENYPDLKASANFLKLQQELANTEDRIQTARRFYNANVRELNTLIQVFPSSIIARWFGFQPREYFEIEDVGIRAIPEPSFSHPPSSR